MKKKKRVKIRISIEKDPEKYNDEGREEIK